MSHDSLQEVDTEDSLKEYRGFIEFYHNTAKPAVIAAEQYDPEGRLAITAVVELRSAFDHMMRVNAARHKVLPEGMLSSIPSISEYCKKNLDKAFGHLYRAAYDSYDIIAFALQMKIEGMLDEISYATLYTIIPNATALVKRPVNEAKHLVCEGKAQKDVESKEKEEKQFAKYEQALDKLKQVKEVLDEHMDELIECEKEKEKGKHDNRRRFILSIIIAVIIAVVAVAVGYVLPR